MVVGAGCGLNQPFPTVAKESILDCQAMGWVWPSRLLPEGEPPGLSQIPRPEEKPVLINHA